jgi:hypothetical protein
MRRSPSIVPPGGDQEVYLVLDDFGSGLGRAWREADVEHTDLETVITDFLDGQYNNPVRVTGFNTKGGWSRDVSEDASCAVDVRSRRAFCRSRLRNSLSSARSEPRRRDSSGLAFLAAIA